MTRRRALVAVAAMLTVLAVGVAYLALPGLGGLGPASPRTSPTSTPGGSDTPPSPSALATTTRSPSPAPTPTTPVDVSILDRTGIRARLQAALDADRAVLAAPAISAAVRFADGSTWSGTSGVADLASGRALSPETPFPIASVSKTFLAAEVMTLVDAGSLHLEDRVARLLPAVLLGGQKIDSRITVRELLDHTSGLRDYLIDKKLDAAVEADPTKVWTPAMALAYVGKPVAAPGAGYHYANTNYVLLGLIAEKITGRSLAVEYRARFFDPLALSSTFYQGAEAAVAEMPTAYQYDSVALDAVPRDVTDGTAIRPFTAIATAAGAAGSVAASAPDLARWAEALYGGEVLPAADVQAMVDDALRTEALKPAYPYGLGVQVFTINGRVSYGHSGRLVGARSAVRWFPVAGVSIAVLTNESRFDPGFVVQDLLAIVAPREILARVPAR